MGNIEKTSENLVIIGGGRGLIGQEIASHFRENGFQALTLDLDEDGQKESDLNVDLSDEKAIKKAFDSIFHSPFNQAVLVNSQAIADPYSGPLSELDVNTWNKYLSSNLTSYMLMCREFLRHRESYQKASIVNISSTRHLMSEAHSECYAASKGGIVSFTHALAMSLGTGKDCIRVNSISPGWIANDKSNLSDKDHSQHPVGRVGRPSDIAELTFFLSNEKAGFITGQDFVSDGGMTKKMIYKD